MMIQVLVCAADGSQRLEEREVSENWFDTPPADQEE